jgi:hypothetical protein
MKTYKFSIIENKREPEAFQVPTDDYYYVMEEAAKLYYYARQGFEEIWPLTFIIHSETDEELGKAIIFLLSALPHFDVIPVGEDTL